MGGATLTVAYRNHVSAAAESMTDFAIAVSPENIEGLTVGAAMSNNTIGTNIDSDESTMYATYATGGFTVGVQSSDLDHTTANSDQESIAYGITYAVNDDLSIGYSYHELDFESSSLSDQESTGLSASYTMGGMTLAGATNEVDNRAGSTNALSDVEGYEFTLSFAF
jgi:outer membrane protein OmpU